MKKKFTVLYEDGGWKGIFIRLEGIQLLLTILNTETVIPTIHSENSRIIFVDFFGGQGVYDLFWAHGA